MSSAQDKSRQSPQSASPQKPKADAPTDSVSQPPSSAENEMDQSLSPPLTAVPPVRPMPSENPSSTSVPPNRPEPPASKPLNRPSAGQESVSEPSVSEPPPISETPRGSESTVSSPTASSPAEASAAESEETASMALSRQQPIPPASEPMQYRAIGLIRGKYQPSEEQFTRGEVLTDDGVAVGAVLLGRIMSLVKKHLDLEESHLWVVYPRTREKGDTGLHVQIVGVWEPEKLNRSSEADESPSEADESPGEDAASEDKPEDSQVAAPEQPELPPIAASELDDKYFSVRGEIIFQSPEDKQLLVKIRRSPRAGDDQSKAFKVALQGVLEGRAVGYFWDLNVQREGNELVLRDGTLIAPVPPQKRGPGGDNRRRPFRKPGGKGGGGQGRWNNGNREGQRPTRPGSSSPRKPGPVGKPIQKRRDQTKPEDQDG